jgi:hypothetical protein
METRVGLIEDKLNPMGERLVWVEEKIIAVDEKSGSLVDRSSGQEARMWALALATITLIGSGLIKILASTS